MLIDTIAIFYRLKILAFYGPQLVPLADLSQAPVVASVTWTRASARSLADSELAGTAPAEAPC
jgi:hypothetical protein